MRKAKKKEKRRTQIILHKKKKGAKSRGPRRAPAHAGPGERVHIIEGSAPSASAWAASPSSSGVGVSCAAGDTWGGGESLFFVFTLIQSVALESLAVAASGSLKGPEGFRLWDALLGAEP